MSVNTASSPELNGTANPSTIQAKPWQTLVWQKVLLEAKSVSAWMATATILRVLVSFLIQLVSYRKDCADNECDSELPEYLRTNLSVWAGWILSAFPHKVAQDAAPGFIYASPWLLMKISNVFGSLPNVPLRIAEAVLGRLSFTELLVLLPVHFVCAISTTLVLRQLVSEKAYPHAFDSIEYSDENPWLLVRPACFGVLYMATLTPPPPFRRTCHVRLW